MKSNLLKRIVATGLFLCPSPALQASVDSVLNLDLKCYFQESTRNTEKFNDGTISYLRLDSKQLLRLIAKSRDTGFPSGSQLRITVDGDVYVADSTGAKLAAGNKWVQAKIETENQLFDGRHNNLTGQENSHNYFPVALTFDLPGLQGTVRGTAIGSLSVNTPNSDGVQITSALTKAPVNGKGTVNGKLSYYDGNLEFSGRKATIIR